MTNSIQVVNDLIQDVLINSALQICAHSTSTLLMRFWQLYLFNASFPGVDVPPPKTSSSKVPQICFPVIDSDSYPHLIASFILDHFL